MPRIGISWALLCLSIGSSVAFASETTQGHQAYYPTSGVAFREPIGWLEQVRGKGKTIAWWISPDSEPAKPVALIMIECGQTPAGSLDEVARGLARNFQGVVDDLPTSLGGTRALRVIAKNESQSLRPVEGLATIHDGRLYLIMGGVTAGHSVKDELESIRASWAWTQIEPPSNHLKFRDKPLSLANGAATINVPALMHTYPTGEPDRVLDLGLHNVVRNAPDFLVYAQIVTTAQGQTFDEYKSRLSDGLLSQHVIKKPIAWRTLNSAPPRVISDTIEAEVPDKAGGPKRTTFIRWALVKLGDRRLVSVNFTMPPDAPGDRNTYINIVDRIVDSIQPGTGAAQPKTKGINPVSADR